MFGLPAVVPVARQIIAQAGLADRVSVQEGNFQHEALGNGYDVALVFGMLNGEPPEGQAHADTCTHLRRSQVRCPQGLRLP